MKTILSPILFATLFVSCSEHKTATRLSNFELACIKLSWEVKEPEIKCNELPPVPDEDIEVVEMKKMPEEAEEQKFVIYKSDWGKSISYNHPFYSYKVDSLVQVKQQLLDGRNDDYDVINVFGHKTVACLTAKELIYYCMAYPCLWMQNCNAWDWPQDGKPYFYPFLPSAGDERYLSDLQKGALRNRRTEVCAELEKYFEVTDTIEINMLRMIEDARLAEMIPVLCKKADFGANTHCYTLIKELMAKSNFTPYYNSGFYNRRNHEFGWELINGTEKEATELKDFAMAYYKKEFESKR